MFGEDFPLAVEVALSYCDELGGGRGDEVISAVVEEVHPCVKVMPPPLKPVKEAKFKSFSSGEAKMFGEAIPQAVEEALVKRDELAEAGLLDAVEAVEEMACVRVRPPPPARQGGQVQELLVG